MGESDASGRHPEQEQTMTTLAPQAPLAPLAHAITPTAPVVIGRGTGSDFVIRDVTVSRRHAAIHREGYAWIVEDLGSKNGTRVNGRPVHGRAVIAPGDELSFGAASVRFDPDERRLFSLLRVEQPAAA
jgi:pSer/pThr/pTyr-binding forkhead associated (FHA) protein